MIWNRCNRGFPLSFDELQEADEADIVEDLSRRVEFGELELRRQNRQIRLLQAVMAMQGLAILFLSFTNLSF